MESTDVYRTIQSGYSELTGMADFLNMSRPELTYAQADALNNNKRGMPPFNVRNAKQIENTLEDNAIVEGFVQIPIYTYMQFVYQDDLGYGSCPYAMKVN